MSEKAVHSHVPYQVNVPKVRIVVCFIYMVIAIFLTACSQNEAKSFFQENINFLMEKNDIIETDFINLVEFEWDEVCFGHGPDGELSFYNQKLDEKIYLNFESSEFFINEKYVYGSPVNKCFLKGQIFTIQRVPGLEELLIKYKL